MNSPVSQVSQSAAYRNKSRVRVKTPFEQNKNFLFLLWFSKLLVLEGTLFSAEGGARLRKRRKKLEQTRWEE